jgi:hypothetical protein
MANPDYALIVVGDDGRFYKLTQDQWQKEDYVIKDSAPGYVRIQQMAENGTYVANVTNPGIGIGSVCILVNAPAIVGKK